MAQGFAPKAMVQAVGLTALVIGFAFLIWHYKGRPIDLVSLAIVPMFLLPRAWKWRRPCDATHAALPTIAKDTNILPVVLTITDEKGRITGRDDGWVAFADGWLVYEGVRTEFSLTKAAVGHPGFEPSEVVLRLYDGRQIGFRPMTRAEAAHLPVRPGNARLLAERFRAWSAEPIPPGTSTLPPRAEHPERAVERLAFPPVYGLAALFLAMLSNAFFGPELVPLLLVAAAGCLLWLLFDLAGFWGKLPDTIS